MVELRSHDHIPERPFTSTAEGEHDLRAMNRMLERLRRHIADVHIDGPRLDEFVDAGEHMIVLPHPELIATTSDLVAVGFFGQARRNIDHRPILELESRLVADMPSNPGLVTYYNVHWPGEGWGNLVLFVDADAKEGWGHDDRHRQAVDRSPLHYHSVRLHNGVLEGGLAGTGEIRLLTTRYLDFELTPPWRAIRRYQR